MAAPPPSPEEQARIDAWVISIRKLARANGCAHTLAVNHAIKFARTAPQSNAVITACVEAGIPEDQLIAIHTLIFG